MLFVSLIFVALVLTMKADATYNKSVECVLRPGRPADEVQGALGYACNVIDCSPIQPGGAHFHPNTLDHHANWAFGEYYRQFQGAQSIDTCDFGGNAMMQCAQNNATGLLKERIIGVNIGGFLVLEPWIVPSLFEQFVGKPANETAIDEYTFTKVLGQEEATKQLTKHWNSWVNATDFEKMVSIGITHIRVPFGYWIFGDIPPFVRGIEQLDRVLDLAANYSIKVLLDLHGAVGSQNGFDNSGRACDIRRGAEKLCVIPCPKHAEWGRDTNGSTVNQTLATITKVAERYKDHPAVWGFELVNEPRLINMSVLKDYYTRGYYAIRAVAPGWKIVIHDGFYPLQWANFMTPDQGFTDVILDTHIYEAFGSNANIPRSAHLQEACGYTLNIDWMQCIELPLIVGEWSLGSTDCTKWLDGFGQTPVSTRCSQEPPNMPPNATFLSAYARRQLSAFYRSEGFFFWNFKTEASPDWDLFKAVDEGWMPSFKPISKETVEECGYAPPYFSKLFEDPAVIERN